MHMYSVLMPGILFFPTTQIFTDVLHSIWLVTCCSAFRYGHHNAGENPEMRTLFYRLCRLLRVHQLVIFVFDGKQRPEIKRGKKVKKTAHWLEAALIEMVKLFGFFAHEVTHISFLALKYISQWCIVGTR
jgi:hypothetical protein